MKNSVIILAAILAFSLKTDGQVRQRLQERTSISFGTQVGIPQGEFAQEYGEASYGIGGTFITKNRFPFTYTGINYTYARMGKLTDEVLLYEGENIFGNPVYERYDASVSNKVHRIHGVARFEPFRGKIQPYIEGLAGGVIYTTRLGLEEVSGYSDTEKSSLETTVAGSIGWAVGLKIQLVRGLFAEGRVETLRGSRASYVDPESVQIDSYGDVQYNMLNSQTNSRLFHIGISLDI